jgi:hypothetical protein
MAKESDMTENQIATLTRLSMILEAGQAENGIDLARQATYAEALRALLARQPAAIDKQEAVAYRDFGRLAQYFDDIGDPHGANVIRTYRDNLYAAPLANEASKPAPSVEQDERGALNADVRAFLENLAEAGSEPLNSVAAYRDKESRLHFMVEVRNGARALLACAASTSANVAQGAELTDEQINRKGDLYGSYNAAEGYWSFSPKEFIDCVRALLAYQVANVAQGAEVVAWLHVLHMEGDQTDEIVTPNDDDPFGIRGEDYDPSYWVTSEPLCRLTAAALTAAQSASGDKS